jgi:acyl-CoA thioesterase-1
VTEQQPSNLLKRIGKATTLCVAIAISLLTFPNAILWMVGAWLVCFTWIRKTSRFAWFPLAACVVILVVKGLYWSPGLIAIAVAMIAVAAQTAWPRMSTGTTNDLRGVIGLVTLWLLWLGANWEAVQISHAAHPKKFDSSRPVVCLGDSLTTGLSDAEAYPRYLQELITSPVINLGRAGITAREALKQLPDVLEANPQVVIIELGGHDFLRGYGRDLARESLVQIIEACRNAGADVVLFEIPRGFIRDPFAGLERELARTYDLELIPDTAIRQLVLRSPTFPLSSVLGTEHLSADGLHPNKVGARCLAQVVRDALERMYGSAILKFNR